VEEAIQICKDYQQQGGWPDESAEIAPLCKPITKDGGMPAQAVNIASVSVQEMKIPSFVGRRSIVRQF